MVTTGNRKNLLTAMCKFGTMQMLNEPAIGADAGIPGAKVGNPDLGY